MKNIFVKFAFLCVIYIGFSRVVAQTSMNASGIINTDTQWNTDIVVVSGDIVVSQGVILNIAAGTSVTFDGYYGIQIIGQLIAQGAKNDTIVFSPKDKTTGWAGIHFGDFENAPSTDSSIIDYCKIEYVYNSYMGAVNVYLFDKLRISNSLLAYNTTSAIMIYNASPLIYSNHIYKNSTENLGGGLYLYLFNGKLIDNVIQMNEANLGGGVSMEYSYPTLSGNRTFYNSANANGGGMYLSSSSPNMSNELIFNNKTTDFGGGLYLFDNSSPTMNNLTIANNSANIGGGIFLEYITAPNITNSIIWGNTTKQVFISDFQSEPKFYYCNIEGGVSNFAGDGAGANYGFQYSRNYNIASNPLFVHPTLDAFDIQPLNTLDWSLQPTSECIESGKADTLNMNLPKYDIIKNQRINGSRIDIGAYEYPTTILCGNIETDIVWNGAYTVECDITIQRGATLTIAKGSVLKFKEGTKLIVRGVLKAAGDAENPIVFTSTYQEPTWGGIWFENSVASTDSSLLKHCVVEFVNNVGAIVINNYSHLIIEHCLIQHNFSSDRIVYTASASPSIRFNTIENNTSMNGIIFLKNSHSIIYNNTIRNNEGFNGGICTNESYSLILNNKIYGNNSAQGGGINVSNSEDRIEGNFIYNNVAHIEGGGIYLKNSTSYIANNLIFNNISYFGIGGGISMTESAPQMFNNTIVNNQAQTGGGISMIESSPRIYNTIIRGNSSEQVNLSSIGCIPEFYNCNVEGGLQNFAGIGSGSNYSFDYQNANNIDSDPLFVLPTQLIGIDENAVNADWSLQEASLSKNAGKLNCDLKDLPEIDIAQNQRIINNIDIGAYEFQETETIKYIFGDTIWQDELWAAPIIRVVCNDIFISKNVELTIAAGCRIEFISNNLIDIKGTLTAEGTKENPIVFTVADTTGYSTQSHQAWKGLLFVNTALDNERSYLKHCTFEYAKNEYPGVIYAENFSNLIIEYSQFQYNISDYSSAIYLSNASPYIHGCTFNNNTSQYGTIYCYSSTPKLYNNLFRNNFSLYNGGALYIENASPQILNNIFVNNTAGEKGGAIYFSYSNAEMYNNVFAYNEAFESGGACFIDNSSPLLENSICWGNKAKLGAQLTIFGEQSGLDLKYNILQNNTHGIEMSSQMASKIFSQNILNIDPLFESPSLEAGYKFDASKSVWKLSPLSQGVNAGNPYTRTHEFVYDFEQNDRIYQNSSIDIGVYEQSQQIAQVDLDALRFFYQSTIGDKWLNTIANNGKWFEGDAQNWFGLEFEGGRVTEINLPENNLSGEVPAEINQMLYLKKIQLYNNEIYSFSTSIDNLQELSTLNLRNNHLSGIIPENIALLKKLTILNLSNNEFSGKVPLSFSNFQNLLVLELSNNNLVTLPELGKNGDFTGLISYELLSVGGNKLTFEDLETNLNVASGFLYSPQDNIGEAKLITVTEGETFVLSVNIGGEFNQYQWIKTGYGAISGANSSAYTASATFDDQGSYYCEITNNKVRNLSIMSEPIELKVNIDLSEEKAALIALYNATDGNNWKNNLNWKTDAPLNEWFGITLEGRVSKINLANNNLNGNIPTEIGKLRQLSVLNLANNQLSGEIPVSINSLSQLEKIYLNNNQLSGALSIDFDKIPLISIVNVSKNNLIGEIPFIKGNSLSIADFSDNEFVDMPAQIQSDIVQLQVLSVSNNKLTFEDLENNTNLAPTFLYSPQANVQNFEKITRNENENIVLTVEVGGKNNHYQWFMNDLPIENATTSEYNISTLNQKKAGRYTCKVTNTNVKDLTIERNPIEIIVYFYLQMPDIQAIAPFCMGDSIVYLTEIGGSANDTLEWYSDAALTHKIGEFSPLRYSISRPIDTLYAVNKIGKLKGEKTIIPLWYRPRIDFINNSLTATYIENATYKWYINNTEITSVVTHILQYPQNGDYYVIITTPLGCTATSYKISMENGVFISAVNDAPHVANVELYPNPSSQFIRIENITHNQNYSVEVFNANGQKVKSLEIFAPNSSIELNINNLTDGLYFVKLSSPKQNTIYPVMKFIKMSE